ncbi:MAG TPA: molybdopterin cofactor-binding domain-containing protein [Thermoanaerobaculia bacterium]|nr:molybdopterin cofactor-binding domain-containing protein [Thermoanaerobaculia bacterium]
MTPESDLDRELREHDAAGRLHWFDVDRRGFLKTLGGGVLVCLCAPAARAQAPAGESGRGGFGRELPRELAAWLHVGEDGSVTVFTGKVEMGQNIRTSLAQQVAEELRLPVDAIHMVMGDTGLTPWDAGTFGSRTTPTMAPQLRAAAATAREALLDLAAQRFNAPRASLVADGGRVTNPATRQALGYGELARGQGPLGSANPSHPSGPAGSAGRSGPAGPADPSDPAGPSDRLRKIVVMPPGQGAPLTKAAEWKIAGTAVAKVGGRDFVTGGHRYTSDLVRPGMMHGKVLRPAGFQATLVSLDTGRAAQVPGVRIVRDGDFVGAVAPDAGTAQRAIDALDAKWQMPPQPSSRELFGYLKQHEEAGERADAHVAGSVEQAAAGAAIKLAQTYTVDYIAHAPLEPRAAVAEWDGGRLTVWTGTQRPFAVRDELAEVLRIPAGQVRVIVPDTGSAYGGKHTADAAVEAARLAKAAGKPVKLIWTREEELTWAYFRPAGVIEVRSAARADGTLVAWELHNYNSGGAAIGTPYEVANQRIQFHPARSPLRQGSYRGLAATANHFARESHMDELAHAAGIEPLQFRLRNLANPRLRAVFAAAAEKFGWGKRQPAPGAGFGIAGGTEKGSFVATCAEVRVEAGGRVRLLRVVEAFECGAVVNPNGLRNQIEGAVVQAIGGALFESVQFENGRILNPRFAKYRLPRFTDVPPIEVVVLDRRDLPSAGAGETPIVGLAPAVANAIFAANGVRLRGMPLAPYGVPLTTPAGG